MIHSDFSNHSPIMPLYEFLRLAIEKLESSHQKPCSTDLSLETENDLVGGQANKVTRTPTHHSLLPDAPTLYGEAELENAITATTEKCGGVEYVFNDISPVLQSGQLDLSHKGVTVPWLSCPVDDSQQDYSSAQTVSVSAGKMLARQIDHTCDPSILSGAFSTISSHKGNCGDAIFGNNANRRDLVSDFSSMKMESRNIAFPDASSCNKRVEVEEIVSAKRYINSRQLLANEPKELFPDGIAKNISLDAFMKTGKCLIQNKGAYSVRALDGERTIASPLSSGNSADEMVSYEEKDKTKRKFCDIEESECQSDELRDASNSVKKSSPAQGGSGSKRRRSTQVHNLSERRRRDRINQKMQALQELIPNCNKADKASMLDEAIEYLKTLKHQVQMMSMGYCVPPLMFPQGSQHMCHPPIPHFSLMGVRMGITPSTNAGSHHCPAFPLPSIQGSYFPTSALGLMNLQGIPVHAHPNPAHHRPHLLPLTGWHHNSSQVPIKINMKKNSQSVFNVEASQGEGRLDVPAADAVMSRGAAEKARGV